MQAMNRIIATNWSVSTPHWTLASSPFAKGLGLTLVEHGGSLVAFSVYRLLEVEGRLALYRSGTEVLPEHQGRGLYAFFTHEALAAAAQGRSNHKIFYGWRTRNPIVWAANAKICTAVTPTLLDATAGEDLREAATAMCAAIYPGRSLEIPDMIMRGAYGHITHRPQSYVGMSALVHMAMLRLIPDPADALFSVGTVNL